MEFTNLGSDLPRPFRVPGLTRCPAKQREHVNKLLHTNTTITLNNIYKLRLFPSSTAGLILNSRKTNCRNKKMQRNLDIN